jgi:hypothetical protein
MRAVGASRQEERCTIASSPRCLTPWWTASAISSCLINTVWRPRQVNAMHLYPAGFYLA